MMATVQPLETEIILPNSEPTSRTPASNATKVAPRFRYTVAIDIASRKATGALWNAEQILLLKPTDFENNRLGYEMNG
jgi:hypothetical protein